MEFYDDLDSIFDDVNEENTEENQQEDVNQEADSNFDIFSDEDIFEDSNDESVKKSVVNKYLESKGFVDSKIKVVDENNEESEVLFSELSEEEQLDILNSISTNNNYSDQELDWVNQLRNNNLTMDSFLELYRQSVIDEINQQESTISYDIDSYNDEELYLLDLKSRYDLSEDELQKELERELEDKDRFSKKITKIREEYKDLEDQEKANQKAQFEAQQQQEYDGFVNQMLGVAQRTSEYHGLELEDSDKNETLSYLVELDAAGTSKFYRDLNDPQKLFEAAWYLKHGKDAFKIISEAYEAEIARLKNEKDKPRVIVRQ